MPVSVTTVAERLKPLFRDAFPEAEIDRIGPSTSADDVFGWDSIAHVNLIVSIEEEFGVRFEPDEITAFSNVGELIEMIARKI